MNASLFSQPLADHRPRTPANPRSNARPTSRRAATLSARQLLDVELGLFLLTQLLPAAPPDALPSLLTGTGPAGADCPGWTPRQHKYLNRARVLLIHFQHRAAWQEVLERYMALTNPLKQAYDISEDRSWFGEKTVGFFRNRVATFRTVLG